jgi:hypothetical protein
MTGTATMSGCSTGAGHQLEIDVGVLPFDLGEQRRKHVKADRHPPEQTNLAAQRLLAVGDAGNGVFEILEHPIRQLQQRLARRRDADAPADPQERWLL